MQKSRMPKGLGTIAAMLANGFEVW